MRKVPLRSADVQDGSLLETENYNKNTVDQKNIFDIISFWSDKQYVIWIENFSVKLISTKNHKGKARTTKVVVQKVIITIIFKPLLTYLTTEKNNNYKMDLADPKSENEVEQETIFNIISAYGM